MTLKGVVAVALRYFIDFGKPAFQHKISVAEFMYDRVHPYCKQGPDNLSDCLRGPDVSK